MKTINKLSRVFLLFLLIHAFNGEVLAQEKVEESWAIKKNEITVEYGFIQFAKPTTIPFGPIQVGYSRTILKWLNVGANFGYNHYKWEEVNVGAFFMMLFGADPPAPIKCDYEIITIHLAIEFCYLYRPRVKLSSGIEGGIGFTTLRTVRTLSEGNLKNGKAKEFSFHVNLFSCRVHFTPGFGFISNVGFGRRGILNVGLFAKF